MNEMNQEMTPEAFSISDLASEFGVTTRTIRFYEAEGLLSPGRDGTRRIFSPRDRTRLRLILRGKRIGLPIAEIKEIVDMYEGPPGESGQLAHLIERLELRTEQLLQRSAEIDRMLEELEAVAVNARNRLAEISSETVTTPG